MKQEEYEDIIITHMVLSPAKHNNPKPFSRALAKSKRSMKPGLMHNGKISKSESVNTEFKFSVPIDIKSHNGKKIRFFYPKDGVKIYLSKEALEKIESEQKKIRSLL